MGINLTFSGAGFLGIYHIGTVSCLKFCGKELLDKIDNYGGSSAGALSACMLLCDIDLEESVQFVMHLASKVKNNFLGPISPSFDPSSTIRKTFLTYLAPNAYKRASGRLHISLTRVSDWKNVVVSEYGSNKDLVDALVCTSFIPFVSGVAPPKFMGISYIDGGFTDNLPQHFEGTTITVSPFSGESDICPDDGHKTNARVDLNNTSVQITAHNVYRMTRALFPPSSSVLTEMCRNGFRDALKYLHIHYPELLTFDVAIVSIPRCCCFVSNEESFCDENASTCSCGSSNNDCFSDIENSLATKKAINSLVFPEQLNNILQKTNFLINESDICWHMVKALIRIGKWFAHPCYYLSEQLYLFANEVFVWLWPKIKELSTYNSYTRTILNIALDMFNAYKGTATCEWHPSLKKERHSDIERSKKRIQTAQRSLVVLPKMPTHFGFDQFNKEPRCGCNAPPPSRVSSFQQVAEPELALIKLNIFSPDDYIVDTGNLNKNNLNSNDIDDDGLWLKKDDDGLFLKVDQWAQSEVTDNLYDPDDYGSAMDYSNIEDSQNSFVMIKDI